MASKRGNGGAKRLDIGEMKNALRDRRVWTGLGVVRQFPGESAYYEIDSDAGVMVDVELMPSRERLFCRLPAFNGVWQVPPVDTEVAVLVPEGDFDAEPIIVGVLRDAPTPFDDARTVIVAPTGSTVIELTSSEVRLGNTLAVDAVIKGTTYNTAFQTFLTALGAVITAAVDPTGIPAAAKTTFATALTAFQATASSWLSLKVKTE